MSSESMASYHAPRILLADGDAAVRRALALLLHTALGLEVVGEAADLTGLAASDQLQADLILVDWASIVSDAPQRITRLRALNRRLLIIALSTRPEDRGAALAAGVSAFISKVDAPEQVLDTVRATLAAQRVEDPL